MPISDLSGTKWILNSSWTTMPNGLSATEDNGANDGYSINYTTNGSSASSISFYDTDYPDLLTYGTLGTAVSRGWSWTSQAYRIIEITGGTDATNATLISWLEANATQVEVTDLAGTNWTFHPKGLKTGVFGTSSTTRQYVNISFSATASTYEFTNQTAIYLTSYEFTQSGYPVVGNAISLAPGDLNAQAYYWKQQDAFSDDQYTWVKVRDNGTIVNLGDENVTISFTSGTDCTNPDLIVWFSQNATEVTTPVGTTYEITHSLTDLTHGNVSFTVTPDTGYSLPSSVTVTNGTLVSYDSSTGIIVVSGDSAEISVTCEQASVGYNVILSGAYGTGSDIVYVQIDDDTTWYMARMNTATGDFDASESNVPNAYNSQNDGMVIPNVHKVKLGLNSLYAPAYQSGDSTGDFSNLTFSSTGGSNPSYATSEITMTQDSTAYFWGSD